MQKEPKIVQILLRLINTKRAFFSDHVTTPCQASILLPNFGISFKKRFLLSHGASPVFYVASPSMVPDVNGKKVSRATYFDEKVRAYQELIKELDQSLVNGDPTAARIANKWNAVMHLLDFHVFSFVKCFDPQLDDRAKKNYYVPRTYVKRLEKALPVLKGRVTAAEDAIA